MESTFKRAFDAWISQHGWRAIAYEDFAHAAYAEWRAKAGAPSTPELTHYVCSRALSPLLYAWCAPDQARPHQRDRALDALRAHLTRRASVRLRDESAAALVAHEALCAVLAGWPRVRDPQAFLGYCQTAVENHARRWLRESRRRALREIPLDVLDAERASALAGPADAWPDAAFERREWRAAVHARWQTVRGLSARDRRIVYLRHYEDLTPCEIAAQLGVTRDAVDKAYSRARNALRADAALRALWCNT